MPKNIDVDRRRTAFRLWLRYRNKLQVSRETGIPAATIQAWAKEEDWDAKAKQVQGQVQASLAVLKKAQDSLVVEDQVSELKLLEYLETQISDLILTQQVQPTKWQDVIETLKFVFQQKRLILGEPTERAVNTIDTKGMKEEDLDKAIVEMRKLVDKQEALPPPPSDNGNSSSSQNG